MPGWHEATKRLQEEGKLQMVGIIEEQHPDRCRLFMQWKQMDWPVMVDSLNLLGVTGVPLTIAIDEYGIVRKVGLKLAEAGEIEAAFLAKHYEPGAGDAETTPQSAPPPPDLADLEDETQGGGAAAWRRYAHALVLWGGEARLDDAIAAYRRAIEMQPDDGPTHFRLGVALRKRYDSPYRKKTDFQAAVDEWRTALEIDPNQYIWRRRIQQYGPRLAKPYPFYDWVRQARDEIRARGETPLPLRIEPGGAEFAHPLERFETAPGTAREPDPQGRIHRDEKGFVQVEEAVVPGVIAPGGAVRAHLVFRPNEQIKAHWNNEVEDLVVWVNPPPGWEVSRRAMSVPNPPEPVSTEPREVEFELRAPADAAPGGHVTAGYALYYVCEDVDGTCLYRRQDFKVPVLVREQ